MDLILETWYNRGMKSERSRLIKNIDKFFSKYIRQRDSQDGLGRCITCRQTVEISKAHAGHFIPRGCMLTRWDERNVALQCAGCNTYRGGEQAEYLLALERKYGRPVVDELMLLKKKWKRENKSFTIGELRELAQKYKELI